MDAMLFIVENPRHFDDFTPERWEELDERHRVFARTVAETGGVVLASNPLDDSVERFPPLTTDGPFAESAEIVLGYYTLRVRDAAHARELAALCPTAGWVELRTVNTDLL